MQLRKSHEMMKKKMVCFQYRTIFLSIFLIIFMNFSCFHYSKSTSSKKVMHRLNLMAKVIDIDTQKPIIDAMLIVIAAVIIFDMLEIE